MVYGIVISLVLALTSLASPAWATTWTAQDCQQSTVQALHNGSSDGDTTVIPAGTCTWTGQLIVTKALEVTGSGAMPAIGAATSGGTTINVDGPTAGCAICAYEATTGNIKISNLNFVVSPTASIPAYGVIVLAFNQSTPSSGKPVVIHHVTMEYHQGRETGIRVGTMRGVISRSIFTNDQQPPNGTPGNTGPTIQCKGDDPYAQNNWASPSTFGAADTNGNKNLYIETSVFTNHGVVSDFDDGCRGVFRYNTLIDSAFGDHGHDTSGVGVRHYEVYNNTFQCVNDWNFGGWYGTRGGTAVITDNIAPLACYGRGVALTFFLLQPLRRLVYALPLLPTGNLTNGGTTITSMSSTVGLAPGMAVWVPNVLGFTNIVSVDSASQITIGNAPAASANSAAISVAACYPGPYPWLRQHGWGWDSAGSDPTPMNNQKLEPIYIWNNKQTVNGTPGDADSGIRFSDPTFAPFPNGPCAWPSVTGTISGTSVTGITPGTRPYFAGLNISGTGVPANTTVASVNSSTSLTLSQAATAGTVTLTLDNNNQTTSGYVQQNREYVLSTPKPGYTKFQYPHPLATVTGDTSASGASGVLAAPTGLTVR